ncbi:MAG: tyrosine-type recombinase/integrase [Acidobacteria bacterium]|nr:tyrosine-type recombinase/integrase [Acidobacteriota bacterium]
MLTDRFLGTLRPQAKAKKYRDTHGLYLLVGPSGGRWWRYDYRFRGKRKTISLGVYGRVSLRQARAKREDARRQLDAGHDPSVLRQQARYGVGTTFGSVADAWLTKRTHALEAITVGKLQHYLDRHLLPSLRDRPIASLTAADLLPVLLAVERGGRHETAHRVKQITGQIFRYAIASGRATHDPTANLREALAPIRVRHHPALTDPKAIGGLLRALDGGIGSPVVDAALQLAALVFLRPGELRKAEWAEIDLARGLWRIPGPRMKMRDAHLVPLAPQAVTILQRLWKVTGDGRLVFPSMRSPKRPISENTLNAGLRRLGYDQHTMTSHGFRTIATTHLNELGFPPDVIERQLAHQERNAVRAAYNRAQHVEARTAMMTAWANWLDGLRTQR